MHNIYSFRERLTGSFTLPEYRFESPDDYVKGINRFIIVNPADAFNKHYNELELYHLGTFDDETAKFDLFDQPVMVDDFGPLCEQMKKRLEVANG